MQEITIICLGDSLTAGEPGFTGYPTFHGNPKSQYEYWLDEQIKAKYPHISAEIANFGVGGNTVWQMVYRFRRDVLRFFDTIDYVVVMGGINDLLGRAALPEDVLQDLKELYELIMEHNAKVIALEVAPASVTSLYTSRILAVNKGIKEIANKKGFQVAPTYSTLIDSTGKGLHPEFDNGDGVHFPIKGYQAIGTMLFNEVFDKILSSVEK